jgi:hypothetical protein
MRAVSGTAEARAMLIEAAARLRLFADVDRRAIDYLTAGETLMASDLVFTEGAAAIAGAIDLVHSAWRREAAALAELEAEHRLNATYAAAGAGVCLVLSLLLMALIPGARTDSEGVDEPGRGAEPSLDLRLHERPQEVDPPPSEPAAAAATEEQPTLEAKLVSAADLCRGLSTARDSGQLRELLGGAAALMEASGLIVWLGDPDGSLRPVMAHGYGPQTLVRMGGMPAAADNAVAATYRSATLQVVAAAGPSVPGAVIAPLVTPAGCVGAMSAEVRPGAESSEVTRALAQLLAAQLSAIVAADADSSTTSPETRAASA